MVDFNKKVSIYILKVLCRLFIERPSFYSVRMVLKPLACIGLITFSFVFFSSAPLSADTIVVEILHSQNIYPAGGTYPIFFRLHISSPWYIHGPTDSSGDLIPTKLSFPENSGVKIENIHFPSPVQKKFDYSDAAVELFSGDILVKAKLKVSKKTPPGKISLKGILSFQACTSQFCLPPEKEQISLELTIAKTGAQVSLLNKEMFAEHKEMAFHTLIPIGAGFWLTIFGIFLGGMALNLTPCIYPLIPITVSYFGGMSKKTQGRTIIHGLLYICGLSITNSILGLTASLTGSMMGRCLQEPVVLILVAGVLSFLALSFFDLWEFKLPSGLNQMVSKSFGGYFGTFFMGLTLGIVAAPCLGPFMLGLLTYVAQKGDPFLGFLYFFILSIGMGLPLAVLAIFSGALKKLPMSGGWLTWIRRTLGWVLVGMAGYMLLPLISSDSGKSSLIAIILAAAGLHLGWLDRSAGITRVFSYVKKATGIVLCCTAAAILFFTPTKEGVKWTPYDPSTLKEAAEKNLPVILDFYADWCSPCKALDDKVFMDPDIVELSRNFVTIRVDLTTEHPYQEKLQKQFNIKGVPTIVFINRKGVVEKEKIESFVDRDIILKRMKRLIEGS